LSLGVNVLRIYLQHRLPTWTRTSIGAPVILEQLSKALERLRQTTPITVLLGEQNVTFALPHADRVYVLEHARIVWEGDPGRFAAEAGEGYL
jgi:branched-chain amino acid transport system ATP-binding protein